ncbi:glycosyltransferase family 2 protein [Microbacterium sp. HD4P20]|uniref:glycosyltransferase family 2 protein n=1 Tax=Microbacterium sp. HD4P20 TaxID=2864874 RepID=UPI001C63FE1B|nr:glycosyltransferase family A protein [Microbacterium sp. HD4P20]MCP2637520.1 glycosyltransferase family 2 protein [Microbacterium sp. HD4P20]
MTEIGVVIPAHRFDDWLDEAVESVLASQDVDLELVVVANGILELPHRHWRDDPRVAVVHDPSPLGPTKAMILGIESTQAPFIARLDADDRMSPSRLSAQVSRLRAQPAAPMVGTATRRITAEGEPAGSIRMPVGDDVRRHLVLSNTVPHSSVMLRRVTLEAVGGYNPALPQMEDYELILRLAQQGPIPVLDDELTEYRVHPGQISRGAEPRGLHIERVSHERRRLGDVIGMNPMAVRLLDLVWKAAQFARYYRITKPGHEY